MASPFWELLAKLGQEHNREVEQLKLEISLASNRLSFHQPREEKNPKTPTYPSSGRSSTNSTVSSLAPCMGRRCKKSLAPAPRDCDRDSSELGHDFGAERECRGSPSPLFEDEVDDKSSGSHESLADEHVFASLAPPVAAPALALEVDGGWNISGVRDSVSSRLDPRLGNRLDDVPPNAKGSTMSRWSPPVSEVSEHWDSYAPGPSRHNSLAQVSFADLGGIDDSSSRRQRESVRKASNKSGRSKSSSCDRTAEKMMFGDLQLRKTWADLEQMAEDPSYVELDPASRSFRTTIHSQQLKSGKMWRRSRTFTRKFLELLPGGQGKDKDAGREVSIERCFARCIALPSSRTRLAWDLLGVLLLCYDLVTIPLQAFELQSNIVIQVGQFVTALFWLLDIFASFFVGYFSKGFLEMRPAAIAKHYLKSWFVVDLTLVTLDLAILGLLNVGGNSSTLRIGKFTRGMRAFRLVRLVKLHSLLGDIMTRVQSEYKLTLLYVMKLITFIVAANHVIACGFYALSRNGDSYTWADQNFDNNDGADYRYWTSMHWSLTQFTPASMEVFPVNTTERFYTVCVLLFALITFSSFVSSITQAMTHLRNINVRSLAQNSALRKYLSEHNISARLTSHVLHYFQSRRQQNHRLARITEGDTELFKALPESIKQELRNEAYQPTLVRHPFFYHYHDMDTIAAFHICNSTVKERRLMACDEMFGNGLEVTHMFMVEVGHLCLEYMVDAKVITQHIEEGSWACEVALWAKDPRSFEPFIAQTACEVLTIGSLDFAEAVPKYPCSACRVARYGAQFVKEAEEVYETCCTPVVVCSDFDLVSHIAHTYLACQEVDRMSLRNSGQTEPELGVVHAIKRKASRIWKHAGKSRESLTEVRKVNTIN